MKLDVVKREKDFLRVFGNEAESYLPVSYTHLTLPTPPYV